MKVLANHEPGTGFHVTHVTELLEARRFVVCMLGQISDNVRAKH